MHTSPHHKHNTTRNRLPILKCRWQRIIHWRIAITPSHHTHVIKTQAGTHIGATLIINTEIENVETLASLALTSLIRLTHLQASKMIVERTAIIGIVKFRAWLEDLICILACIKRTRKWNFDQQLVCRSRTKLHRQRVKLLRLRDCKINPARLARARLGANREM